MSLPKTDRGVAIVEFAFTFIILVVLAIGAFEYGLVFRDSLTVSNSTREASRVGASAADNMDADCLILDAAAGVLQSLGSGVIEEIQIYKSDENGVYPGELTSTIRQYAPWTDVTPPPIFCASGSGWDDLHLGASWDPDDRVDDEGDADWIGVRVKYDHSWSTGFPPWTKSGVFALSDDAVFRIEPPPPDE